MRNKKFVILSLCLVMILGILSFTGCTKGDIYNINIDLQGKTMVYETVSHKALPSCALVRIKNGLTEYITVGAFVTADGDLLIDGAMIPADYNQKDWSIEVRVWQSNDTYKSYAAIFDNINGMLGGVIDQSGLAIIKLITTDKFTPVDIAKTETVAMGEDLLAVSVLREGKSAELIVFEGIVSNTGFGDCGHISTEAKRDFEYLMMTVGGHFNPLSAPERSQMHINDTMHSRPSDFMAVSDAILFDLNGDFVGFNRLKLVDIGTDNENIVHNISYAVKSDVVVHELQKAGILKGDKV